VLDDPFKKNPDHLEDAVYGMKTLKEKVPHLRSIVITDVRDKGTKDFLSEFSTCVFNLPRSGTSGFLSTLLAVVPM